MTVTNVRGFGQQYGRVASGHRGDIGALTVLKLRVDVVVQDEMADPVVVAIAKSVDTGTIGDGKIWVTPVSGRAQDPDRRA